MLVETEDRLGLKHISQKDRLILPEYGFTITKLTGKSLRELIESGDLPISEYKIDPNLIPDIILDERSKTSEVAYNLTQLFLPNSRKASYHDQLQLLHMETADIESIGIKNMKLYIPSVSDVAEIAAIELTKGNRIFGRNFIKEPIWSYPWIRTSTEIDPDSTVIIGCDDLDITPEEQIEGSPEGIYRGIHISKQFPKTNNKHSSLYAMRIFAPAF